MSRNQSRIIMMPPVSTRLEAHTLLVLTDNLQPVARPARHVSQRLPAVARQVKRHASCELAACRGLKRAKFSVLRTG